MYLSVCIPKLDSLNEYAVTTPADYHFRQDVSRMFGLEPLSLAPTDTLQFQCPDCTLKKKRYISSGFTFTSHDRYAYIVY